MPTSTLTRNQSPISGSPASPSPTPYDDPNKPLQRERSTRGWKSLLARIRSSSTSSSSRDDKCKIPKSSVPLTQRNLTEYFNPEYMQDHEAFAEMSEWESREERKRARVSRWLDLLP